MPHAGRLCVTREDEAWLVKGLQADDGSRPRIRRRRPSRLRAVCLRRRAHGHANHFNLNQRPRSSTSGHLNLANIVDHLNATVPAFADATRVLLTGCSAGGVGTYGNVDWLASARARGSKALRRRPSSVNASDSRVGAASDWPHWSKNESRPGPHRRAVAAVAGLCTRFARRRLPAPSSVRQRGRALPVPDRRCSSSRTSSTRTSLHQHAAAASEDGARGRVRRLFWQSGGRRSARWRSSRRWSFGASCLDHCVVSSTSERCPRRSPTRAAS